MKNPFRTYSEEEMKQVYARRKERFKKSDGARTEAVDLLIIALALAFVVLMIKTSLK